MNCTNCGKPLKEGTAVCSACGKEVVLTSSATADRKTMGGYKKKSKIKKALSSILIVLLIISASAAGVYFFADWKTNNTRVCPECNQKFIGKEKLCENCLRILEAEYDDEEDVTHFCNQCGGEFESEALICEKCLKQIDEDFYKGNYFCNTCKNNIEKELIAVTDTYGYVYCVQCDSGNYCQKCHGVLDGKDDDAICVNCAAIVCHGCEEVLNKNEVAFEESGVFYCAKCSEKVKKKACSECGKELPKEDDDTVCIDCAEYYCEKCREVLVYREVKRESGDKYYCEACEKEEKFCDICGKVLNPDEDDKECPDCAEYVCEKCNEVLKENEVAAAGDDGEYYCEVCFEKINDEILKNIDKTS